ncbi:MAG: low-specificity L-threonine aldolase [Ardenticatenaceae bacterium]|nr:low-specificity L-threonine aldolase [Ardenticatenaceae bacterium]
MDKIDFRSDTVSWPTPAMREAMAKAPIGDDVYGEDPSINELERLAAAKVGKEAGMFVTSGTMGNLTSVLAHAQRGDEAIVGYNSHVASSEAGGMAVLGSVTPRALPTDKFGRMDLAAVESAVRADDPHYPRSRLICVENSYGNAAGYPLEPDYFASIRQIADRHNLQVHMDGARVFNAAVALNVDVRQITDHVDSLTFCLSKGLCAPVGSVVCGSEEFIYNARRVRKMVGGGMRQAGMMAAAGIVALHEMIERLADDHHHARLLAEGLSQIPGIEVDMELVNTNMVYFNPSADSPFTVDEITQMLRDKANIWVGRRYTNHFRAVTHYWIGEAEVNLLVKTLREIMVIT